jgi:hypothetical protein
MRQFHDSYNHNHGDHGQSREPLPRGLPRDTQRRADLRPADLAGSQKVDHRLELVSLALHSFLDRSKPLQQALGRQCAGIEKFNIPGR